MQELRFSYVVHRFYVYNIYIYIYATDIKSLVPEVGNLNPFAKNCFLKRWDHGKNSYERRVYESVDDNSLYLRLYLNIRQKKGLGSNGFNLLYNHTSTCDYKIV